MKIDTSKIKWRFWQKMYGYDLGDGLICMFDGTLRAGEFSGDYKFYGTFCIYKTFTMSSGGLGVNKTRPLYCCEIELTKKWTVDQFYVAGINECYEQYMEQQHQKAIKKARAFTRGFT